MTGGPALDVLSRQARRFTESATHGKLELQSCAGCGNACYPPREACPRCWSAELCWNEVPGGGLLLTETILHTSFSERFRDKLPWYIGTVQMDAGPTVLAHLHQEVAGKSRVRVVARLDETGQGVLVALPDGAPGSMADDLPI